MPAGPLTAALGLFLNGGDVLRQFQGSFAAVYGLRKETSMLRWLRRICVPLVAFALLGFVPTAKATTLAQLLVPGATISSGDKLFSNFSYNSTGDMPAAGAINVIPIGPPTRPNLGLRFQGGFSDSVGGGGSDALITYRVTVTDPNLLISDAHLDSNLIVNGDPGGPGNTAPTPSGTINETFSAVAPPAPPIGQFNINFNFDNTVVQLHDDKTFSSKYQAIDVQKDIFLDATNAGIGNVGLSFVDQTFSQAAVPLPGAAFAGMGLMSLLGFKKLRSHQFEA